MRIFSLFIFCFSFIVMAAEKFDDHLIELDDFQNRANSLERKIRDYAHEMKLTQDKAKIQEITHLIVKDHEDMEKLIKRAEKLRSHMRFEHPDKGEIFDTKYPRLNKKSLKQLENELGLDKILSELYKKVGRTFPNPEEEAETCKGEHCVKKGVKATPTATPDERIKLSK